MFWRWIPASLCTLLFTCFFSASNLFSFPFSLKNLTPLSFKKKKKSQSLFPILWKTSNLSPLSPITLRMSWDWSSPKASGWALRRIHCGLQSESYAGEERYARPILVFSSFTHYYAWRDMWPESFVYSFFVKKGKKEKSHIESRETEYRWRCVQKGRISRAPPEGKHGLVNVW